MDLKQAESIVSISEHLLPEECVKLPTQYVRAAFRAGEVRKQIAREELELKALEAKRSKDVRDNPDDYGISKSTRDAVDEVVMALPELIKKRQQIAALRADLENEQSVLTALEFKKSCLKALVSLTVMSYNGEVRPSREEREGFDQAQHRSATTPRRDPRG